MLLAPDIDSYTGNIEDLPSIARVSDHYLHCCICVLLIKQNRSEWLLVDKHLVELSGLFCDRIGVGYKAFRNQPDLCTGRINE